MISRVGGTCNESCFAFIFCNVHYWKVIFKIFAIWDFTWRWLVAIDVSGPLKMGPIGCPESTSRNSPEERRSHLHRSGSVKSRKLAIFGIKLHNVSFYNFWHFPRKVSPSLGTFAVRCRKSDVELDVFFALFWRYSFTKFGISRKSTLNVELHCIPCVYNSCNTAGCVPLRPLFNVAHTLPRSRFSNVNDIGVDTTAAAESSTVTHTHSLTDLFKVS
jgi:hypothetical protein